MKLTVTLIIMSLLIFLSTSSFLWLQSLMTSVESGHASTSQLQYIKQFGLQSNLYQRMNLLEPQEGKWLEIAKVLSKEDGAVALKIGTFYYGKQQTRQAKLWLLQAVRLKSQPARLLLAKIYLEEKRLNQAKNLLIPIIEDKAALRLLIDIAITQGELALVNQYAQHLKMQPAGQALYKTLLHFQIIKNDLVTDRSTCLAKIQPFATSLKNLTNFEQLIKSEKLNPLRPYVCFAPVKYISKKRLACQHESNEAIRCDETIWQKRPQNTDAENFDSRYSAILVENGGANVNAGILYIDSKDTVEVFFHEIAHLLGFVDEYPLAKNHQRCLSIQKQMFSHNIAVLPRLYQGNKATARKEILAQLPWGKYINSSTKVMTKTTQGWLLGTELTEKQQDSVGVYLAETCTEQNFVAVKPLQQRTALRYFEEEFPSLYIQFLKDSPERFLMPDYHFNGNRAIEALGQKK